MLRFALAVVMLVALTVLYALKRNIIIDARTNLAASNETEGIVRGMSTTMMHTLNIDYSRLPDVVMHAGDSVARRLGVDGSGLGPDHPQVHLLREHLPRAARQPAAGAG